MALNISKMYLGRPQWHYSAAMQFAWRMIVMAMIDALKPASDGTPTDEELLARDWIATSEMPDDPHSDFVSFPRCCEELGISAEDWRVSLLAQVDEKIDYDTDECWKQLEYLAAQPLVDDEESSFELPEWARVVPALDQVSFLSIEDLIPVKRPRERMKIPHPAHRVAMPEVAQLGFVM